MEEEMNPNIQMISGLLESFIPTLNQNSFLTIKDTHTLVDYVKENTDFERVNGRLINPIARNVARKIEEAKVLEVEAQQ